MKPKASRTAFEKFSVANAVVLSSCTPRSGFTQMFKFYETVLPVGCGGDGADMLLYQWGTYDWGSGEHFELNLTRQFIEQSKRDDDSISQLGITYKFKPTAELRVFGSGNRWCHSLTELKPFREFVEASAPFLGAANTRANLNEVAFSYV
jgi:hypothetical protein